MCCVSVFVRCFFLVLGFFVLFRLFICLFVVVLLLLFFFMCLSCNTYSRVCSKCSKVQGDVIS